MNSKGQVFTDGLEFSKENLQVQIQEQEILFSKNKDKIKQLYDRLNQNIVKNLINLIKFNEQNKDEDYKNQISALEVKLMEKQKSTDNLE